MTEQLFLLVGVVIGSIIGPVILVLMNKVFSKPKDDASLVRDMQIIAQQAVDDLKKEREENHISELKLQKEVEQLKERVVAIEATHNGPFRLTLEFTTSPLSILVQRLEVVSPLAQLETK